MERVAVPSAPSESSPRCAGCGEASLEQRCPSCGAVAFAGGFRVQQVLSVTPHGRMYLAVDGSGQRVALKELVFALVPDLQQLDAFQREARMLEALQHPGVPRYVRSFREGQGVHTRLYLAQEFIEGESLARRVERAPLPIPEWTRITEQLLELLRDLHGRAPAVLHRDLKPANVILRPDGRVAVVDFGSARELAKSITYGATLVGTFGYMAPEQLGGTVDARSDLYSLGVTLAHLLTRRPPAEAIGPDLALSLPRSLGLSKRVRTFLARLCAIKPIDRFRSAAEALEFLRRPWYRRPVGWRALLGAALATAVLVSSSVLPHAFPRATPSAQRGGPGEPIPSAARAANAVAEAHALRAPPGSKNVYGRTVGLGVLIAGAPDSEAAAWVIYASLGTSELGVPLITLRVDVHNPSQESIHPDLQRLLSAFAVMDRDGRDLVFTPSVKALPNLAPYESTAFDLSAEIREPRFPFFLRVRGQRQLEPISF